MREIQFDHVEGFGLYASIAHVRAQFEPISTVKATDREGLRVEIDVPKPFDSDACIKRFFDVLHVSACALGVDLANPIRDDANGLVARQGGHSFSAPTSDVRRDFRGSR